MKKTTIICDGCKKEIAPVLNGAYPKVSITMQGSNELTTGLRITELCEPCFRTIRESIKVALQACDDVGKDQG